MDKGKLFEKIKEILEFGKEGNVDFHEEQVRYVIKRLYQVISTPEPDYSDIWKRLQVKKRRYARLVQLRYAGIILFPLLVIGGIYFNKHTSDLGVLPVDQHRGGVHLILSEGKSLNLSMTDGKEFITDGEIQMHKDSVNRLSYPLIENDSDTVLRYNILDVPVAADYYLRLSDGTGVNLNADTRLRYPVVFHPQERKVYLEKGEAYFDVAKNAKSPFRIKVRDVEIEALGTSFNVNAYPDKESVLVTLAEGKVLVHKGSQKVILSPGEQVECEDEQFVVKSVNIFEFIAWKEGMFIFNRMSLENIMQQIQRWYGVEVIFFEEQTREYTFTGMITRDQPVEEIFKIMERTVDVHFSFKNNKVVITK